MIPKYDFEETLTKMCEFLKPLNILEWGPGYSTEIMQQKCSEAQILSIEHKSDYCAHIQEKFKYNTNVEVVHQPICKKTPYNQDRGTGYVTLPLWRQIVETKNITPCFDMVFIDGRARFDCVNVAWLLVKQQGVVLLHDGQRENYFPAIKTYPYYDFFEKINKVAVMSHSPFEEFKTIMRCENE